ncbi:MAG: hypothetical protein BGO69_04060 [Bacteroidetes bacterium 46-16]|nr:MAG: hypothetical protein BGO69_04060 [Bacteroidetes bacterium 46-16]
MVKYIKPTYCRCPLPLEQVKARTPSLSPFIDEHETTGTPSLPPFFKDEYERVGNNYFYAV